MWQMRNVPTITSISVVVSTSMHQELFMRGPRQNIEIKQPQPMYQMQT
jgi:hypothetical protein